MVELEVLLSAGTVAAVAFVVWRQRVACRLRIAEMARQEATESSVQVTAVDVPPLGRFPTAEDALSAFTGTTPRPAVARKTPVKRGPKKSAPKRKKRTKPE